MGSASPIMSLADANEALLAEIAQTCGVSPESIEDVYSCTPIQLAMIEPSRSEVFHLVMSFGPTADVDRFCDAILHVVSLNSVLRTRIVDYNGSKVQVVLNQQHVTERRSGDVNEFLCGDTAPRLGLNLPLFSSAFVGRELVVSIHHAIMDHWSMTACLRGDVAGAYLGHAPPPRRTPFKRFVEHCVALDEAVARQFWESRFSGVSAIFPQPKLGYLPCASQKSPLKIILARTSGSNSIPMAHLPYYSEAAWAITSGVYANSTTVAYGYVLSGRSTALDSDEDTLGLTIAEVPIQVTLPPSMTVEQLIKDRAGSLRQLQGCPALQYGMEKIASVSDAARVAAGCQTLFNIRPFTDVGVSPEKLRDDSISFRQIQWLRGSFPLQLILNILEDGVLVEVRADEHVLPDAQLSRVLHQYAHTLRMLTQVPPNAKLGSLPLLSPEDRDEIFRWHDTSTDADQTTDKNNTAPLDIDLAHLGVESSVAKSHVWIVEPRAPFNLAPIGAVGELLIQQEPGVTEGHGRDEGGAAAGLIPPPHWWSPSSPSSGHGGTRAKAHVSKRFLRTGVLARYNHDGSIASVGRLENRVMLRGQPIQLEDIESVLMECDKVRDAVAFLRISQGRTRLVALVSLSAAAAELGTSDEIQHPSSINSFNNADGLQEAAPREHSDLASICAFAKSRLPSERIPSDWYVVRKVPRTPALALDRAAAKELIKTAPRQVTS